MVKVFNQQGRLLLNFGGPGYYPGQFMGPWGIAIGPSNQVIVSETFPGRVQVFRYISDAEAADMKVRRDGAGQKSVVPASGQPNGGAAKPIGAATPEQKPGTVPSPGNPDLTAKKDSAAP
jgi:hypothetical protein